MYRAVHANPMSFNVPESVTVATNTASKEKYTASVQVTPG